MDASLLSWLLLIGAPLLALAYGYAEYQAYLLRTEVKEVPGGLRFTARDFSVEARRHQGLLQVSCQQARWQSQTLPGGQPQTRLGRVEVSLPVPGLRIQVVQRVLKGEGEQPSVATGFSSIVFNASDELMSAAKGQAESQRSSVQMDCVPDSVAKDFQAFASGLDVWIDKLERGLRAEIIARKEQAAQEAKEAQKLAAEQAAELAAAQKLAAAGPPASGPVATSAPAGASSPAQQDAKAQAQLAQWRQNAGFSGSMTEMRLSASGEIESLIDLDPTGRVIVHADKRHFHGSLKGATVTLLAQELELMVRDDYWQEGDTQMPTFKLLKGASRDTLSLWRNRFGEAMERFQVDPGSKPDGGSEG